MWTNSSGLNRETLAAFLSSLESIDGRLFGRTKQAKGGDNSGSNNDKLSNGLGDSASINAKLGPINTNGGGGSGGDISVAIWESARVANFADQDDHAAALTASTLESTTTTTAAAAADLTTTTAITALSTSSSTFPANHLLESTCCQPNQRELELTIAVRRRARMLRHWHTNGDVLDKWRQVVARPGQAVPRGGPASQSSRPSCEPAPRYGLECGQGSSSSRVECQTSSQQVGPTTELNNQHEQTAAIDLTAASLMRTTPHSEANHASHHNHINTTPTTIGHHHHHPHHSEEQHNGGVESSDSMGADLAPRKPWQSLVLPVVLACIIFLVALWTRQISLAVTNDTILMIMILMGLFILMSGLALWLSCDQYLDADQASNGAPGQQQEGQLYDGETRPVCRCHHLRHHHHHNYRHNHNHHRHRHHQHRRPESPTNGTGLQNGQSNVAGLTSNGERRCHKCCAVSVIDCQPPDYYSAVMHSMPVHHYLLVDDELEHQNGANKTLRTPRASGLARDDDKRNNDGEEEGEEDEDDRQRYLSPPSYDELQKDRR